MLEVKARLFVLLVFLTLVIELANVGRCRVTVTNINSRKTTVTTGYLFVILLFWFYGVCASDSHDLYYYRYAYDLQIGHGKEPFFDFLTLQSYRMGFNYDTFKLIWFSVISLLMFRGIRQFGERCELTAALVLLAPGSLYITGMRSSMVGAIMLNAFPLLFTKKKRDIISYILVVLACAQIHMVSYVYLLFLVLDAVKGKSVRTVYFSIVFILTAGALLFSTFMNKSIGNLLGKAFSLLGENSAERASSYFSGEGAHFRYQVYLVFKHLFFFYLTDKACKIKINDRPMQDNHRGIHAGIKGLNTILLALLPITILSASFERVFSYFLVVQYSEILNATRAVIFRPKDRIWVQCFTPLLATSVLVFLFIELYFSSSDLVILLNSLEWPFK